jgi:membrane protein YqaA with SNARE-associated domain
MTSSATATLDPRVLAWRPWLVAFTGFLLVSVGLLLGARGAPGLDALETLTLLALYTSVACTFLPLPTAWIVLWAARSVDPWTVALVAALGTCIANVHDYYIVNALCRLGRIREARQSKFHDNAVRWFHRAPFLTLSVASFAPIPVDFVRLLAVSTDYPRRRYVVATFVGRFPRYLLLAALSWQLQLSNRAIAVVLAVTVVVGLLKGAQELRERLVRRRMAVDDDS